MTQVNVNINHDNIRNDMAIQIATLVTEKAVLAEQVRVLATEKLQLEEALRQATTPAEESAPEVIEAL
ncbi:hypothetical protein [Bacillus thuringiensis]|uniref:hypothetical protein n=1 Tax=Bacillus thuringiensis TaxID=1428 RepID=UPI0011123F72|nr:hypothetical protein [Bacillus thuringiensis]QCY64985.1 hypothetical protein FHE73_30470 [Bacillus thuringiensis]